MNLEGCFDFRPDVKYPHQGATTLLNLGAKLHLGAIRNELSAIAALRKKKIHKHDERVEEVKKCQKMISQK